MNGARALEPTPIFWAAMYAASALGTNLGDFAAETMRWGLSRSFLWSLAFTVGLVVADRLFGRATEVFFWFAIVVLRASATNIGDFLTHDVGVSRFASAPVLALATLAAGYLTRGVRSPLIDLRYWVAMFLGGMFGTVAGDLASHVLGLPIAAAALAALLAVVVAGWSAAAGAPLIAYWAVVLVERAAGTPAGDLFAEPRGLGVGLPIAMAITGAAFALALALRGRRPLSGAAATEGPQPAR